MGLLGVVLGVVLAVAKVAALVVGLVVAVGATQQMMWLGLGSLWHQLARDAPGSGAACSAERYEPAN